MSYQKMCFGQNENEFWMKEGGGLEKVMEIKESGEYVGKSKDTFIEMYDYLGVREELKTRLK